MPKTSAEYLDGNAPDELPAADEVQILSALQEIHFSMNRLLGTMDNNISILKDSVREVQTAHHIAAESNRMAWRRRAREGSPGLMVASK